MKREKELSNADAECMEPMGGPSTSAAAAAAAACERGPEKTGGGGRATKQQHQQQPWMLPLGRKSFKVLVCDKASSKALCSMSLSDSALHESKYLADSLADHWNDLVASTTSSTASGGSTTAAAAAAAEAGVLEGEPHVMLTMSEHVADTASYEATLRLLDGKEPRQEITSVKKALKILQVASELQFEDGVAACLRYAEAVPWTQEEELEVLAVLTKLGLEQTKLGARVIARLGPTNPDAMLKVLKKLVAQAIGFGGGGGGGGGAAAAAAVGGAGDSGIVAAAAAAPMRPQEGGEGGVDPRLMWRKSVEKVLMGSSLKVEVKKRVLFEQLDDLIDRIQTLVLEEGKGGGGGGGGGGRGVVGAIEVPRFVDFSREEHSELLRRFMDEMSSLAWMVEVMVRRLSFGEYIIKWLSEDEPFVRHVAFFCRKEDEAQAAMYAPLLLILFELLEHMVAGQVLIPTATRLALVKLWLPVVSQISKLPRVFSADKGRRLGVLFGQLILTLPSVNQEEVMDGWLASCNGGYNEWIDMGHFVEVWLDKASRRMRDGC